MRINNIQYILCFLVCVFIFVGCQDEENIYGGSAYAVLQGKVKYVLSVNENESEQTSHIISEYIYDEAGKLIKVTQPHYNEGNHSPLSYREYSYNNLDALSKIAEYNSNLTAENGYINLRNTFYYYDQAGRMTKELTEFPEINSFEYNLYEYEGNAVSRIIHYNEENSIIGYSSFEYNEEQLLIKESRFGQNDDLWSYTVHLHENGLNTQSYSYSAHDEPIREIKKEYNEDGFLIKVESEELLLSSSAASYILKYEYY